MQDSETTSLSVGIDIVEVPRIGQALARWGSRFRERVFTPNEQAECAGRVHSLAARFAAKEAAAKALGTGIGAIRWQDVEVICDRHGKPHLHLRGAAREIARRKGSARMGRQLVPHARQRDSDGGCRGGDRAQKWRR